jgi:hypothetical protein
MAKGAETLAGRYAPHLSRFLGCRLAVEPSWTGWGQRGATWALVLRLHLAREIRRDDLGRCQNYAQVPIIDSGS